MNSLRANGNWPAHEFLRNAEFKLTIRFRLTEFSGASANLSGT